MKGRKYSLDWEITFPWLRYSVTENSAHCAYCLVFGDDEGMFRTVSFNDWKNPTREKRGTFKIHEKSKTHVSSMDKADNLVMISHEKKLAATVRLYVVVILVQRNIYIAFRGNWDKELKM